MLKLTCLLIVNLIMLKASKLMDFNRMKRDYKYGYHASSEEIDDQWPKPSLTPPFITYQPKYHYNREQPKLMKQLQLPTNSPFSVKVKNQNTEEVVKIIPSNNQFNENFQINLGPIQKKEIISSPTNDEYITKQQYVKDLLKMKKYYETKCQQGHVVKNVKNSTLTQRPLLVRSDMFKPHEVSVQTAIFVKDPMTYKTNSLIKQNQRRENNRMNKTNNFVRNTVKFNLEDTVLSNFNKVHNKLDFVNKRRKRSMKNQFQATERLINETNNNKEVLKNSQIQHKIKTKSFINENLEKIIKIKNTTKHSTKNTKKSKQNNFLYYYDDEDDENYYEGYDGTYYNDEISTTTTSTTGLEIKNSNINSTQQMATNRKRIRRRPPSPNYDYDNDDYDYEEETDEDNSFTTYLSNFFHIISYPVQKVMTTIVDNISNKDHKADKEQPQLPSQAQYTLYHNVMKQQQQQQQQQQQYNINDDYYDDYNEPDEADDDPSDSSSLSNWFSSWFNFNRRNKKIGTTTTIEPIRHKPLQTSYSWLPSWLSFGMDTKTKDDYDKWFSSWFGNVKDKVHRKPPISASTTTQFPHVPILTIVDPMRNPQSWIGLLTNHIVSNNNNNNISTISPNPFLEAFNRMTPTTSSNKHRNIQRKITYDKYQIWRLKALKYAQVKALEEYKLSDDGIKLKWLKGPSLRGLTDILVPPQMLNTFQDSLYFDSIDHEVLIYDVGKAIAYENFKENYRLHSAQKGEKDNSNITVPIMTWNKYYGYEEIIKYLEDMQDHFPQLIELIHIGRSYEGRPLVVVKIENKDRQDVSMTEEMATHKMKLSLKRMTLANAVFIEAGVHGMEWIAPATATWIVNKLLRIMKTNESLTNERLDHSVIRNTTWYLMPILNPDGYVYSHEYDRFWKKTRSRHISRPIDFISTAMTWLKKKNTKEKICHGVDLDHNWHYQWNRKGSSSTACSEHFAGPAPFSEPEAKALAEFLLENHSQIKLFVSLQAYGQILSFPIKANSSYTTARSEDMLDVAMTGIEGLHKNFKKSRYKVDSNNDLVEQRSGSSDAFSAFELSIPYTYTLHLPDNGVHGYLLPSSAIESTANDAFHIITNMLDFI